MKRIINLKTGIGALLLALMVFVFISAPMYGQLKRQPFDNTSPSQSHKSSSVSRLPSGPSNGFGDPGDDDSYIPGSTGEDGDGGTIRGPVPVKDVLWLLPFLAIGYGIYCRQRERGKN